MEREYCPHCKSDQTGPEIPLDVREQYDPATSHYSRTIGVEISEIYDGILFFECPDCHGRWHAFTDEGDPLREEAMRYVEEGAHGANA